jgi:hypothetical protein
MPNAASASIAINGTRDRVMPRAPENLMVDSLNTLAVDQITRRFVSAVDTDAIVGTIGSSMNLGFPQFRRALTMLRRKVKNESHLARTARKS